jgi:hypothetical protein
LGLYLEDALLAALDHLHVPAKHAQRSSSQCARVAVTTSIGKDGLEILKAHEQPHQKGLGSYPVLNTC